VLVHSGEPELRQEGCDALPGFDVILGHFADTSCRGAGDAHGELRRRGDGLRSGDAAAGRGGMAAIRRHIEAMTLAACLQDVERDRQLISFTRSEHRRELANQRAPLAAGVS